jgi:dinuclear metal center YbgI/SA1388 family protein
MVHRDKLTAFVFNTLGQELLTHAESVDSVPNNVQIHGSEEVSRVVLGVSASPEFIEQAVQSQADYLIVHHGLRTADLIGGRFDAYEHRLRLIFQNDMTLSGYHYALDAHKNLGNNALIIEKLQAERLDEPYFDGWGWVAEFDKPQYIHELADRCSKLFKHDVFAVYAGPEKITRMGVCSGGARPHGKEFFEILDQGIELHLTGEISESGPYMAEEGSFNYFACGHYATEVFGIQALGEQIKKKFGGDLEVEFIDVATIL